MRKKHLFAVIVICLFLVVSIQLVLAQTPTELIFDIVPGDDTNVVNINSQGLVPVAILSTDSWDATDPIDGVDPETVTILGVQALAVRGKAEKSLTIQRDVDRDGNTDWVVQIQTEVLKTGIVEDTVKIEAMLMNGTTTLTGYAPIKVVQTAQ